ncbi:MAG: methyl-accepting chemotaxis protein [SAR324 cluster bacterium]|nr:methyl-accepting chemotaxis protein [SAR324 cluster bacterium]
MKLVTNLTIATKLYLAFISIMICFVATSFTGWSSLNQLQAILHDTQTKNIPALDALIQADRDLYQLMTAERSLFLVQKDSKAFEKFLKSHEENAAQAERRSKKFIELALNNSPEELKKFSTLYSEWSFGSKMILTLLKQGTEESTKKAFDLSMGEVNKNFGTMRDFLDKYQESLEKLNQQNTLASDQAKAVSLNKTMISLLIGLMLGAISAFVIKFQVAKPLGGEPRAMAKLADEIAHGNLVFVNKEGASGLCDSMQIMAKKLHGIMTELSENSNHLANSSEDLSNFSTNMSSSAEEVSSQAELIARATSEIGKTIDQVAATITQVAHNIKTVANASNSMTSQISSVSGAATQMSSNLESIQDSIEGVTKSSQGVASQAADAFCVAGEAESLSNSVTFAMKTLSQSATEIGAVTGMIKQIAEQTNLLALNANIEAASAGDAGKGFAVVANEIKELAKQSGSAAENISSKIIGIQADTTTAVGSIEEVTAIIGKMSESSKEIDEITQKQASSSEEIFRNVRESVLAVNEVANLVLEMSDASSQVTGNITELEGAISEVTSNAEELKMASNEVFHNISEIASATRESAKGSSFVSEKAQEFTGFSKSLNELTNQFKLQ